MNKVSALLASLAICSAADAQELSVALRCDPLQEQNPVLSIVVDGSHNAVRMNDGWFSNGNRYRPQSGCIEISQFVAISDDRILFGSERANVEGCGALKLSPRTLVIKETYSIDRQTGILRVIDGQVRLRQGSEFQCQKVTGKIIP